MEDITVDAMPLSGASVDGLTPAAAAPEEPTKGGRFSRKKDKKKAPKKVKKGAKHSKDSDVDVVTAAAPSGPDGAGPDIVGGGSCVVPDNAVTLKAEKGVGKKNKKAAKAAKETKEARKAREARERAASLSPAPPPAAGVDPTRRDSGIDDEPSRTTPGPIPDRRRGGADLSDDARRRQALSDGGGGGAQQHPAAIEDGHHDPKRSKSRSRSGSGKRFNLFRRRGRSGARADDRRKSETDLANTGTSSSSTKAESDVSRVDAAAGGERGGGAGSKETFNNKSRNANSLDRGKGRYASKGWGREEERRRGEPRPNSASLEREAFRRYDPAKEPRTRLQHMTVKDALCEYRHRRNTSVPRSSSSIDRRRHQQRVTSGSDSDVSMADEDPDSAARGGGGGGYYYTLDRDQTSLVQAVGTLPRNSRLVRETSLLGGDDDRETDYVQASSSATLPRRSNAGQQQECRRNLGEQILDMCRTISRGEVDGDGGGDNDDGGGESGGGSSRLEGGGGEHCDIKSHTGSGGGGGGRPKSGTTTDSPRPTSSVIYINPSDILTAPGSSSRGADSSPSSADPTTSSADLSSAGAAVKPSSQFTALRKTRPQYSNSPTARERRISQSGDTSPGPAPRDRKISQSGDTSPAPSLRHRKINPSGDASSPAASTTPRDRKTSRSRDSLTSDSSTTLRGVSPVPPPPSSSSSSSSKTSSSRKQQPPTNIPLLPGDPPGTASSSSSSSRRLPLTPTTPTTTAATSPASPTITVHEEDDADRLMSVSMTTSGSTSGGTMDTSMISSTSSSGIGGGGGGGKRSSDQGFFSEEPTRDSDDDSEGGDDMSGFSTPPEEPGDHRGGGGGYGSGHHLLLRHPQPLSPAAFVNNVSNRLEVPRSSKKRTPANNKLTGGSQSEGGGGGVGKPDDAELLPATSAQEKSSFNRSSESANKSDSPALMNKKGATPHSSPSRLQGESASLTKKGATPQSSPSNLKGAPLYKQQKDGLNTSTDGKKVKAAATKQAKGGGGGGGGGGRRVEEEKEERQPGRRGEIPENEGKEEEKGERQGARSNEQQKTVPVMGTSVQQKYRRTFSPVRSKENAGTPPTTVSPRDTTPGASSPLRQQQSKQLENVLSPDQKARKGASSQEDEKVEGREDGKPQQRGREKKKRKGFLSSRSFRRQEEEKKEKEKEKETETREKEDRLQSEEPPPAAVPQQTQNDHDVIDDGIEELAYRMTFQDKSIQTSDTLLNELIKRSKKRKGGLFSSSDKKSKREPPEPRIPAGLLPPKYEEEARGGGVVVEQPMASSAVPRQGCLSATPLRLVGRDAVDGRSAAAADEPEARPLLEEEDDVTHDTPVAPAEEGEEEEPPEVQPEVSLPAKKTKPKGSSLRVIVSLKQKLARNRKKKEGKNKKKKKGEEEDDEDKVESDLPSDTFITIENELNLSKLAEIKETDILDDELFEPDFGPPLPRKHLRFEPITSDEPIQSEEPLPPLTPASRRLKARRNSSRGRERRKKCLHCCKQFIAFLFSHIGLCSLVVGYTIMGGFVFQALESPHEAQIKSDIKKHRMVVMDEIMSLATALKLHELNQHNLTRELEKKLKAYQKYIHKETTDNGWDGNEIDPDAVIQNVQWSFASALLYAITVMTTIGYGHVAPKTATGRMVTIGYAVLGIPLTLLCLTNIGDVMASGFRLLYGKVCCGLCCKLFKPSRRRRRRAPDVEKGLPRQVMTTDEGKTDKPKEVIQVPTSLCLLLIAGYIFAGSLLFSLWEEWDFLTGSYFCFITLSTIGFGDIVPGMDMHSWSKEWKLALSALYLVFGLSLIAMCFNLVQEDVKAKCRWLGMKIGIIDKPEPPV